MSSTVKQHNVSLQFVTRTQDISTCVEPFSQVSCCWSGWSPCRSSCSSRSAFSLWNIYNPTRWARWNYEHEMFVLKVPIIKKCQNVQINLWNYEHVFKYEIIFQMCCVFGRCIYTCWHSSFAAAPVSEALYCFSRPLPDRTSTSRCRARWRSLRCWSSQSRPILSSAWRSVKAPNSTRWSGSAPSTPTLPPPGSQKRVRAQTQPRVELTTLSWDVVVSLKLNSPASSLLLADTPQTCVIHVTQLERDTILVCLDSEWHTHISYDEPCFRSRNLLTSSPSLPFSLCRVYKDCESSGKVEIQQEVVSRAHFQLPDRVHR